MLIRALLFTLLLAPSAWADELDHWSATERRIIESLRLKPAVKTIDSSLYHLGKSLFFDTSLSKNHQISCATCHQPRLHFTDGKPRATGLGQGSRNTPSLRGASLRTWHTWDGRKDSVWSQSLAPLENIKEHGISRIQAVKVAIQNSFYLQSFNAPTDFHDQERFPTAATPIGNASALRAWKSMTKEDQTLVNQAFANMGLALSHFISSLQFTPTRFDQYAEALSNKTSEANILTPSEINGLKLFINKQSGCINCHSGSQFSNQEFFNIGTGSSQDRGRASGVKHLLRDPFNCTGAYSPRQNCNALKFTQRSGHELKGSFLVPPLRGAAVTAPYMHDGRFPTLGSVIAYYASNPQQFDSRIHLPQTQLSASEQQQLVDFIETLN